MNGFNNEGKYAWTDNKQVKVRRALNYDKNLRKNDTINIPWTYISMMPKPKFSKFRQLQECNLLPSESQELEYQHNFAKQQRKKASESSNISLPIFRPPSKITFNLCMEALAIGTIICALIIIVISLNSKPSINVSQCFLKFKELGCSLNSATEECKKLLTCLQSYGGEVTSQQEASVSYYLGPIAGFFAFVLKAYIKKILVMIL